MATINPSSPPAGTGRCDTAARDSATIARNVAANWLYYVLVVITGFIVPRLIDHRHGAELLGVWDFGWSLVSYVGMLSLGIASSVNRYVARYRAVSDWMSLNVVINSSLAILVVSFAVAVGMAAAVTAAVPLFLPQLDVEILAAAKWSVFLLTFNAAFMLPNGVFEGILTGHERYDVVNLIRGARDAAVFAAMYLLLRAGYGIVALAGAVLAGELLADVVVVLLAFRICPTMRLSLRLVHRNTIAEMIGFGGKTMLQGIARLLLYQTNSVLVGSFLGPAALAVYSRQRVLVMHALRLLKKYSFVFVPASGRLHASGDETALRNLLIDGSLYGFYITAPMIAVLVVLGGPILELWMGPHYRAPLVLTVLALGHFLSLPQETAYSILTGMNRHGLASIIEVAVAAGGVLMCVATLGMGGGMTGAALSVAVPVTVVGGVVVPVLAARAVRLPPAVYFRRVLPGPLAAVTPVLLWLLIARELWDHSPLQCLLYSMAGGTALIAVIYWLWVLPAGVKTRVARVFGWRGPAVSLPAASDAP